MKKETSGGCSAEVRVKGWVFLAVLFAFFFPPAVFWLAYLGHGYMFGSISA